MPEAATQLTVARTAASDVQNRQIYLTLDGSPLATLLFGREVTRSITPGTHVLVADNTLRKKKLTFTIAEGEHASFQVASVPGWGYMYLVGLFGAAPINITLERVAGPDSTA